MKRILLVLSLLFTTLPVSATPKKLKVMIADSGLSPKAPKLLRYVPKKYQTPEALSDIHGHGTHILSIIDRSACEGVELIPCVMFAPVLDPITHEVLRFEDGDPRLKLDSKFSCFDMAIKEGVDVINFSGGGYDKIKTELVKVRKLKKKKITLVAAAGNDRRDLIEYPYYPASYPFPNVISVGSINSKGERSKFSNYSPYLVYEKGELVPGSGLNGETVLTSGTSQAAALRTAKIVRNFCNKTRKNLTVVSK